MKRLSPCCVAVALAACGQSAAGSTTGGASSTGAATTSATSTSTSTTTTTTTTTAATTAATTATGQTSTATAGTTASGSTSGESSSSTSASGATSGGSAGTTAGATGGSTGGSTGSTTGGGGCDGLDGGDDTLINAALSGPNAVALLCPNAVFLLNNPIQLTAAGQSIQTWGLPTDQSRAILRIANGNLGTAIFGNGQASISLSSIQVDGNLRTLGRSDAGSALIEIGAAAGQTVQSIAAYDTRTWSTLHLFEGPVSGGVPTCQSATVVGNTIGPAGQSIVTDRFNWADGLSIACGDSLIQDNLIFDPSDGAIVLFGAPGTLVEGNTLVSAGDTNLFGGINLVDYAPLSGNSVGTVVSGNTVSAPGGFITVAVGMGPAIWGCPGKPGTDDCDGGCVNRGATVEDNLLVGTHLGYGYAADGVASWTATGNVSTGWHSGTPQIACGQLPVAPEPFLLETGNAAGSFQPSFASATSLGNLIQVLPDTGGSLWIPPACTGATFSGCALPSQPVCTDYGNSGYLGQYGGASYASWDPALWSVCNAACNADAGPDSWCAWTPPSCAGGVFSGCASSSGKTCGDPGSAADPDWNFANGATCAAACALANPDAWCTWQPPSCSGGTFAGCASTGKTCSDPGSAADPSWTPDLGATCAAACALIDPNASCAWVPPACDGPIFTGCRIEAAAPCSDADGGPQFPGWTAAQAAVCQDVCARASPDSYCLNGS